MRIAYLLTSLGIGGAERQVIELAQRMAARGHEIELFVIRPRAVHEFSTKLQVMRLNMTKSPLGVCRGLIRGRSLMREFEPDLLHSHTFPANMVARILRVFGAAPRVLSTIHNIYEGGWLRMLAYRLSDPLVLHATAVCQAAADRYVRRGAVSRRKCSVITNGIDIEVFAPLIGEVSSDRRAVPGDGSFVWLAAGRAVPAKDFENLLAAFRRVRGEMPNTQLWIAGERGKRQDRSGRRVTESNGVRWLGHQDNMAATIAAADAFVLSSAWEGMPLVVGEAMAMEKPVVATGVGGVRELVGDAGILAPAQDPQKLAAGMLRIMQMPESKRRDLGKAARARMVQYFDMNVKAAEWEGLYARLLQKPVYQHGRLITGFQKRIDGNDAH